MTASSTTAEVWEFQSPEVQGRTDSEARGSCRRPCLAKQAQPGRKGPAGAEGPAKPSRRQKPKPDYENVTLRAATQRNVLDL